MSRIMVLYDALVKWILHRSWWSLVGAAVLIAAGRWLQDFDALQLLRDFTVYFRQSIESVNVFSFVEHVYRAFTACSLVWDGGLMNICDGGVDFLNRGLAIVTLPFGSFDVFELEGGGAARFIKFPLYAVAFVIGSIQSLGLAAIAFVAEASLLGVVLLIASLVFALFLLGGGAPLTVVGGALGQAFDYTGLWELFGNFVVLLVGVFVLLIVAAFIALGLQLVLDIAVFLIERTLGGAAVFCGYCYGGYKFLKSADELALLAKGKPAMTARGKK